MGSTERPVPSGTPSSGEPTVQNPLNSGPGTLSRTAVKGIVTAAMVLNHAAAVFLSDDSLLFALLTGIGYSTAVAMCFFLTEGFAFTRSRAHYGKRLLLFGILSEVPYVLAFLPQIRNLKGAPGNMILTLFLCFLILSVLESLRRRTEKTILLVLLFWLSCFTDWALLAPGFTVMFYAAGRDSKKLTIAFIAAAMITAVSTGMTEIAESGAVVSRVILFSVLSLTGPVMAGILILRFYLKAGTSSPFGKTHAASAPASESTEKARGTQSAGGVEKWFFYWFYPAHLLLLGILRIMSGR